MGVTNGTEIVDRYRIERRLGVGGMSTVQLAFDQRLERYVAIKLLAEHLADDPTFVSRFRREALAAARLVHPNIVQVFDFGFDERQGQHFIVMEHVPGHSCAELLRDHGRLEVDQAVDVVTQACRGLDYAHRNGVVHRDVKPGNLLVSDSDVVKLADFGIARATDQSSITQVGSVLGTAAYLAPEQARGEAAGPRADLYSLGVVSYQLLTGRLPYEANSLSELALKQQREPPPPVDELNPRVPPELADAVAGALALDQEERPASAARDRAGVDGTDQESRGHRRDSRAVGGRGAHGADPGGADSGRQRPRTGHDADPPARAAPSGLPAPDQRIRSRRGVSRPRPAAAVRRRARGATLPCLRRRCPAVRSRGGCGRHDCRQRVEERRALPEGRCTRHEYRGQEVPGPDQPVHEVATSEAGRVLGRLRRHPWGRCAKGIRRGGLTSRVRD